MGINATLDNDDGKVNELVEMIDRLMAGGDGHVTINADEFAEGLNVKTYRTSDCGTGGKSACCQPTEDDAIDNDED